MNTFFTFGLTMATSMAAMTVSAQLVRVEVDYIDNQGQVPGESYRIYAVMENEGDILDAIY